MKQSLLNSERLRRGGLLAAGCTLAAGVFCWSWYAAVDWLHAPVHEVRFAAAEEAARRDPGAVDRLNQRVERHAANSLLRVRRQRAAGIVALGAAAVGIALLQIRRKHKPTPPESLVAEMARRRTTANPATNGPADTRSPAAAVPPALLLLDQPPVDLTPLEGLVERVGRAPRHLIPLLHAIDAHYRYIPPAVIARLPQVADVTPAQIAGVVSFYEQFRTRPRGEKFVQVCVGTACHVAGADRILPQVRAELGIPPGRDTDTAGHATVETVGCLGCCTRAPVVQVDGHVSGHVQVEDIGELWADQDEQHGSCEGSCSPEGHNGVHSAEADAARARGIQIRIGLGSCCVAGGSRQVMEAINRELHRCRLQAEVKPVGCVGVCHLTPLVEVRVPGQEPIVATRATPADVQRIIRTLPAAGTWSTRLVRSLANLWQAAGGTQRPAVEEGPGVCQIMPERDERLASFTSGQVRIVTEHCGEMNPESYEEYRCRDGFVALEKVLAESNPAGVIDTIDASGLRGRGGGGFPTGKKWQTVAAAEGEPFLVCNGDEGDPGAFMDRMIMESYPYRVLEGMAIAAYAVGARQAIIYVRREYPLAVRRLRHAIAEMTQRGWLGPQNRSSGFSLEVEIVEGAGAFVCGEETALLESIMGRRGTPRFRPPYPAEHGLWDRPTLVNNVETYANVPWIIRHGAAAFSALGVEESRGTKVFSLAGKVRRGGLVEVPMGVTIRHVVEEIGGGVAVGRTLKAVQIGGPSGGCIPARLADTPIDYQALRGVDAIMGSGGLVVMDDADCMVDVARYFLEFTQRESCGHCTFCRLGTERLLEILTRLCEGKGKPRDLDLLESLSQQVIAGSLCGLGKTAPNPVLTTLRYFREEYEAHVAGKCPAGRCKALVRYVVTNDCIGCTLCAQHCPAGAIPATPYRQHVIEDDRCTRCDVCRTTCPEQAIKVTS